jgi:hypothetical protein
MKQRTHTRLPQLHRNCAAAVHSHDRVCVCDAPAVPPRARRYVGLRNGDCHLAMSAVELDPDRASCTQDCLNTAVSPLPEYNSSDYEETFYESRLDDICAHFFALASQKRTHTHRGGCARSSRVTLCPKPPPFLRRSSQAV